MTLMQNKEIKKPHLLGSGSVFCKVSKLSNSPDMIKMPEYGKTQAKAGTKMGGTE